MFININLLIAICLLAFPVPVFAGGLNFDSNHFAVKHNNFSRHKSMHTNKSFAKHKLKFNRNWHYKTKHKNKTKFPYFVYYPHQASHGIEREKNVQIDINVIDNNKEEKIKSTVDQYKSFSPPHIVNLEDVEPQKSSKNLKRNKPKNVILIYGTKVIEKKITSD